MVGVAVRLAGVAAPRIGVAARLLAICLVVSACGGGPVVAGVSLDGTRWTVVQVAGLKPVPGREPTITFSDGGVSGFGGCNPFGAQVVKISDGRMEVSGLAMTAALCGPPNEGVMRTESDFYYALKTAAEIGFRDDLLVITGKTGELWLRPAGGGGPSLQ